MRVGPAGWAYADWDGRVTPRKKPRSFHALAHLAKYVGCVEVNSSFYGLPLARNAERWVRLVEDQPDFCFTAKLFQGFTHGADLRGRERALTLDSYRAGIAPLANAGRLWALLAQFPLSFHRTHFNVERLERIAGDFDPHPLILEVRHRSWFEPDGLRTIEKLGYSLATIDLPAAPDHPPADVAQVGPLGYLRLHGRNADAWFDSRAGRDQRYDYLYNRAEVGELAAVARRLATGADETAVITNNHFSGKAVANALELIGIFEGQLPLAPVEIVEAFPYLKTLVRLDGQTSLF
ncbi:MAG: hypothetical protein ACI8QS_000052 [Planctomycetota bacterium]|jgi:uncharacterized protein YecE (DUF72 family)